MGQLLTLNPIHAIRASDSHATNGAKHVLVARLYYSLLIPNCTKPYNTSGQKHLLEILTQ